MSFKNRVGTFFIMVGTILLFVFATSVFSPGGNYEVTALLAGALLFGLGWQWRLSKAKGGPPVAAPSPKPAAPPPKPAPGPAKKPGPLGMLMKGRPKKKAAPAPPRPAQAPLNPARKPGKRK